MPSHGPPSYNTIFGIGVGVAVGSVVGVAVGSVVGIAVGSVVGIAVGPVVGVAVGVNTGVGIGVGKMRGSGKIIKGVSGTTLLLQITAVPGPSEQSGDAVG